MAGISNFIPTGQTTRGWRGLAEYNGDILAATYNGDIYKQTGGVGSFVGLSQTSRYWEEFTVLGSDVYASTPDPGYIYKQTGGVGNFIQIPGQTTTRGWQGMTTRSGDVYCCVDGGDIYKQTGGTGNFVALGQTSRAWRGMAEYNGDIYASVYNGDIYKQTGGTGNFIALGQTSRAWEKITVFGSDVYCCVDGGDIYKQTGGTGNFVALGQTSRAWRGMANLGSKVYASVYNGDIYVAEYRENEITNVDPSTGITRGALITITGTGLQGASTTEITIDGTDYSSNITSVSSTQITFFAPNLSNADYDLIVITDGVESNSYSITYSSQEDSMLAQFLPMIKFHEYDSNGDPLAGGKVYTYTAGSTPSPVNYKVTYTTPSKSVENANPVILDASGRANIVLDSGAYKIVVTDSDDVELYTIDNVTDASALSGTVLTTVSDLKDASYENYRIAQTSGYYAYNDGGAGFYYFNSASTATANDGSVILPNGLTGSDAGRWLLVSGNIVTARQFGATGDGTTNDYTAIVNAYTYLNNMGGGVLIFNYGAYNFTSALTIPSTVDVQFRPGAYLKSTNTSNLTINKMSDQNLSKRFDSTLGTITLGTGVPKAFPQWFGAVGDGSTNDSTAIQKCLTSASIIEFPYATYKLTTGLTVGTGRKIEFNNSILSPNANSITVITFNENTSLNTKTVVNNLYITNGASQTSILGIDVTKSLGIVLNNIHVTGVASGVQITNASNMLVNGLSITSCTNAGLKLISNVSGTAKIYGSVFNDVILDANACGLYVFQGASSAIQNIKFNALTLKDNTVNGAFLEGSSGVPKVSFSACHISGNGSGSASIAVETSTVYKSDIYLKSAHLSLNDSVTDSSLNNSIQLVSSSVLTTNNYTGYASTTNTHILTEAGSYVIENGLIDATGYVERVQTYGIINSIGSVYICHGAGKSVPVKGRNFFATPADIPQTPTPTVSAPATLAYDNCDKGLVKAITFAASTGSDGTNSASILMASGMSGSYQISTMLIRASAGSKAYTMKWESNTASYSHNIVLNSDQDSWRRLVFITADKTSHTLKIFPTNSAGSVLYMTDAMVWDGDLESVSNIYNSCIVGIRKQGNYRDDNGLTLGGTWNRSDKIYYAAPVSLGAIGVVNTAAGSPGTFTEFGQVY